MTDEIGLANKLKALDRIAKLRTAITKKADGSYIIHTSRLPADKPDKR